MSFLGTPDYTHGSSSPIGILLTNVGTPAAPTPGAVRPYLAEFLGDRRVVELPAWLWRPLLHGILLNIRPRRSARLYARVWTDEGSPLLLTLARQAAALQAALDGHPGGPFLVVHGMRYGRPSIAAALRRLGQANVRRLLVFPLFPQYSATTTATTLDAVFGELSGWRWMPELRTINDYHDDPGYIAALAASVREQWAATGRPERLLLSFHGIPRSYFLKGDPYPCQCRATARLLAEALALPADTWQVAFQSRLGPSPWLEPYTDRTLAGWGAAGLEHVDALCPGFSADCLETTDEVGREGKHAFQAAGGGAFHYLPALNDRPDHIAALREIALAHMAGWLDDRPGLPPPARRRAVAAARAAMGLNGQTAPARPVSLPPDAAPRIVVIGGGIAGLSAAWELEQAAGRGARITLLEAGDRWGGKIRTDKVRTDKVRTETLPGPDGGLFIVDAGPESFVTRKRAVWDLVLELGLADRVIDPGGEARGTYVLDGGRPVRLPLDPLSFARSPLLSTRGKLRLLAEPFMPRKGDDGDESLAAFVTRRLGREALEKFVGPVLGGIYNANPETQSILVTSPVMRQMEDESRSLVLAAVKRLGRRRGDRVDAPPGRFIGFAEGAGELVDALVDRLQAELRLGAPVRVVEAAGPTGYEVVLADGERLPADAVIVAAPANVAARLLAGVAPAAAAELDAIRHNHIGTVSLAYRAADVPAEPDIRGLMIPRREGRRIDAITWTSRKIPGRAPAGASLLRVFFGGGDPSTMDLDDAALVAAIREELRQLLGLDAEPLGVVIARWPDSYPQADVGHLERVAAVEAALPPGLFVTGSSYRGLAVPDCIAQGRATARAALAGLLDIARQPA